MLGQYRQQLQTKSSPNASLWTVLKFPLERNREWTPLKKVCRILTHRWKTRFINYIPTFLPFFWNANHFIWLWCIATWMHYSTFTTPGNFKPFTIGKFIFTGLPIWEKKIKSITGCGEVKDICSFVQNVLNNYMLYIVHITWFVEFLQNRWSYVFSASTRIPLTLRVEFSG